jgi:hypothetical protein
MKSRQFRVLYREFLFGIVDRELLSTHAKGDASQLLLQIVALLVFLSVCCSVPALASNADAPAQTRLMFAWSIEHFLIATTMLVVGLFAVLSWDAMFPGHRDVLVLAPLPIQAHTILLAKLAAVATALGLTVVALHVASGVAWPLALNAADVAGPAAGGVRTWLRLLIAYWLTMVAAGTFVFGLAMSAQGIAASLLPRRHFLRLSSWLQLGAFCLIVGAYFLQPMAVRPGAILAAQQRGILASSPSYWFLGLFQQLDGSSALAPLARRAWLGLALAVLGTAIAYGLSYVRTLRRIAEEPDATPGVPRLRWLPAFGDSVQTAVVQFSIRTLCRSAQHRVILAFYWGMGFAFTLVFLKTPRARLLATTSVLNSWREASVPLLVSSVLMVGSAVLAARLAFAMPRDLHANWIFRLLAVAGGRRYVAARRRALIVASAAPVWTAAAIVFLRMWPWRPAAGHLVALALLSLTLIEIALDGTEKIPFTCSYLPGRSRLHLAVCAAVIVVFPLTIMAATFERDALQDPTRYAALVGMLGLTWVGLRWRTALLENATGAQPQFEDEPTGDVVTLDLWDSRFARSLANTDANSPPARH